MKIYKVEVDNEGTKFWYNEDGKIHRDDDQPAVIRGDGSQEWWKDGKQHREGDKPAVIYPNGSQIWYKNGKKHRDGDKPAMIFANGYQSWWKDGKEISEEEVKRVSTPSQSIENSIIEVNGEKFKLVKV